MSEALPVQLSFINKDGRFLKFKKPVKFQPRWDVQSQCFFIHDKEALGMPIEATGETIRELIDDLTNTIFLDWKEYALASYPRGLKNGQRIWRTELLERVSEPDNPAYLEAVKIIMLPEEGNWATDSINADERHRQLAWKLFYGEHFLDQDEIPKEFL